MLSLGISETFLLPVRFFLIYTWPPKLTVLLAPALASPSKGRESNSRNKKSLQENKTHLSEREFMRTIISMSGSRCQQYFLLSRCVDGVLVRRGATSCLRGGDNSPGGANASPTDADEREEEKKSSRSQDSRLPQKQNSPRLPLHLTHFPLWLLFQASAFTMNLQHI